MRIRVESLVVAGCALALTAVAQAQQVIDLPNFCNVSSLTLNGEAAALNPNSDCVLRLTNGLMQAGSAFGTMPFQLAADASFSSFFCFQIRDPIGIGDSDGPGADGLVFVVQTVANNVGGIGGGLGYLGIPNSVGIEFDTFFNSPVGDPDGNHVGIDTNGSVTSLSTASVGPRMNDGDTFCAWVDYNGVTDLLEVRLAQSATRPTNALLSRTIDLLAVLGSSNAFVGFTAGTGDGGNTHEILSFEVIGTFAPINPGLRSAPALSPISLVVLVTTLFVLGIAFARRRAQRRQ